MRMDLTVTEYPTFDDLYTYAGELGYRIKHLGIARRTDRGVELRVHPTLIPHRRLLANVDGVMNAVLVKGDMVGPTLYYGAGAGSLPTASAVVADIIDVTRTLTTDPENRVPHLAFQPGELSDMPVLPIDDVVTAYYLRMTVDDGEEFVGIVHGHGVEPATTHGYRLVVQANQGVFIRSCQESLIERFENRLTEVPALAAFKGGIEKDELPVVPGQVRDVVHLRVLEVALQGHGLVVIARQAVDRQSEFPQPGEDAPVGSGFAVVHQVAGGEHQVGLRPAAQGSSYDRLQ